MALSEELKRKYANDKDLLYAIAELEDKEGQLSDVTKESIARKTKLREYEAEKKTLAEEKEKLLEKYKRAGFDPNADIEEQIAAKLEDLKTKSNLKPASELDKVMRQVEKLQGMILERDKKIEEKEKQRAEVEARANLEKASNLILPKASDVFDKSAALILGLESKTITLKDGKPGIKVGEDFYLLDAPKGQDSAIDILKNKYADYVVTKQKTGSGGGGKGGEASGRTPEVTLDEFNKMTEPEKREFATVQKGKVVG